MFYSADRGWVRSDCWYKFSKETLENQERTEVISRNPSQFPSEITWPGSVGVLCTGSDPVRLELKTRLWSSLVGVEVPVLIRFGWSWRPGSGPFCPEQSCSCVSVWPIRTSNCWKTQNHESVISCCYNHISLMSLRTRRRLSAPVTSQFNQIVYW